MRGWLGDRLHSRLCNGLGGNRGRLPREVGGATSVVGSVVVERNLLSVEYFDHSGLDLADASLTVVSGSPDDDESSLSSNLVETSLHTLDLLHEQSMQIDGVEVVSQCCGR